MLVSWAETQGRFVTGVALFADETQDARASHDYRRFTLFERWVTLSDAPRVLAETFESDSGGFKWGRFTSAYSDRKLARFENLTGWPEWTWQAGIDRELRTELTHAVAAAPGLPPFLNGDRAVEDWVYRGRIRNRDGRLQRVGELTIVLPDTRGALGEMRWERNLLTGTLRSDVDIARLELQLVAETADQRVVKTISPAQPEFAWETPDDARGAEVYLVHASGELMGHTRVSPGEKVHPSTEALNVAEQAVRDLSDGENERIEFKPFVERKHEKERELIATVVAFANSEGGRLYVGLTNEGAPEGEPALRRAMKSDATDAFVLYRDYLLGLFSETIKPVPEFDVDVVSVSGQRLLVARVEKGRKGPYSTKQNELWIRKGSSNMRPDPKTELPALYSESDPVRPVVWSPEHRLWG